MKKKWKPKFYIHRHPDDPPFRRVKIKKSLTKTQTQENITKMYKLIGVLLINGCLVSVSAAAIFIALVGVFRLF